MDMPPEEKNLRTVSFATHATRGIIRDQSTRRKVMCVLLAVAVLMVIAGSTIFRDALIAREHPFRFLFFWAACAWITITALLLALLDLLLVRAHNRAAQRALRKGISSAAKEENAEE